MPLCDVAFRSWVAREQDRPEKCVVVVSHWGTIYSLTGPQPSKFETLSRDPDPSWAFETNLARLCRFRACYDCRCKTRSISWRHAMTGIGLRGSGSTVLAVCSERGRSLCNVYADDSGRWYVALIELGVLCRTVSQQLPDGRAPALCVLRQGDPRSALMPLRNRLRCAVRMHSSSAPAGFKSRLITSLGVWLNQHHDGFPFRLRV
eukprot:3219635-Rhodomonas_salina.1